MLQGTYTEIKWLFFFYFICKQTLLVSHETLAYVFPTLTDLILSRYATRTLSKNKTVSRNMHVTCFAHKQINVSQMVGETDNGELIPICQPALIVADTTPCSQGLTIGHKLQAFFFIHARFVVGVHITIDICTAWTSYSHRQPGPHTSKRDHVHLETRNRTNIVNPVACSTYEIDLSYTEFGTVQCRI